MIQECNKCGRIVESSSGNDVKCSFVCICGNKWTSRYRHKSKSIIRYRTNTISQLKKIRAQNKELAELYEMYER